jgi:hypothetical protein
MIRSTAIALMMALAGCTGFQDHPATRAATQAQLPAGDPSNQCRARTDAYLDFFGVKPAQVEKYGYVPIYQIGPNDERIIGHEQSVKLQSCPESSRIVLRMDTGCRLAQAYTRGDCPVDGLPAF